MLWFTGNLSKGKRQFVVSTLGSLTSRCRTAEYVDNLLLHSTRVANYGASDL